MLLNDHQLYNEVSNINNNILDLCFGTIYLKVTETEAIIREDTHHPALSIYVEMKTNLKPNNAPTLNFQKANYMKLNSFFLRSNCIENFINWNPWITRLPVYIGKFMKELNNLFQYIHNTGIYKNLSLVVFQRIDK